MTSIEWLEEKLIDNGVNFLSEEFEFIKQAKEMHKAEIEDAFQDGKWDWNEHITNGTESKDLEQYYKETFKNNNNEN
jgi:hypothetical protein